jgi:DNA (cytosine-5)-methyltransferase 1
MGSLFDGAGTCCFAAELCGIQSVWSSEIEKFPLEVTAKRFPKVKQLGDITKINGAEIEPVDIITFGSPCQDLSIAGKREGLDGERSGLFMEAIRIIKEMRNATANEFPRFVVWENVPGAYSSNQGEDFRTVLEEIVRVKDGSAVIPRPSRGGANLLAGTEQDTYWVEDIPSRGERSMLNFGECPSVVEESTLSQILEENVPTKYYLSETACRGILRRSVKRGKTLPTLLKIALIIQGNVSMQEATEMGLLRQQ